MNRLAPAALAGVVVGLGLGLGANVSGAVLALYGLTLATLLAAAYVASDRRTARRRHRADAGRTSREPSGTGRA